jgi:hypothetical protein
MTTSLLTHDQHKAAESAFHGLPLNPRWSDSAQQIYRGILSVTNGRDVVEESVAESRLVALPLGA